MWIASCIFLCLLMLYVSSYFFIKMIKPKCLTYQDYVLPQYKTFYWPIRWLDAKRDDSFTKITSAEVTYIDFYQGDYYIAVIINGKRDGIHLGRTVSIKKLKRLKRGTEICIQIEYDLRTDLTFENKLFPYCTKITVLSKGSNEEN